jgi:predicted component of type VI protein secretion system
VWDQQAGFEVLLGPLDQRQLHSLLPIGTGFNKLRTLTRFYVGEEQDFKFRLKIKAEEIPELRLGSAGDTRLGWSVRLKAGTDADGAGRRDTTASSQPRLGQAGGNRLGWTSWLKYRDLQHDDSQLCLKGKA